MHVVIKWWYTVVAKCAPWICKIFLLSFCLVLKDADHELPLSILSFYLIVGLSEHSCERDSFWLGWPKDLNLEENVTNSKFVKRLDEIWTRWPWPASQGHSDA